MDDIYVLRRTARLSIESAAELCGVSPRTIRSWEKCGAPAYAINSLKLSAGFPFGDMWQGWRFADGLFWSPEGVSFTAGEIRAIPYHHALIAEISRNAKPAISAPDYDNVLAFSCDILNISQNS